MPLFHMILIVFKVFADLQNRDHSKRYKKKNIKQEKGKYSAYNAAELCGVFFSLQNLKIALMFSSPAEFGTRVMQEMPTGLLTGSVLNQGGTRERKQSITPFLIYTIGQSEEDADL